MRLGDVPDNALDELAGLSQLEENDFLRNRYWCDPELQRDISTCVTKVRGPITAEEFGSLLTLSHPQTWAPLLYEGWRRFRISTAVVAMFAGRAWAGAERPEEQLPTAKWLTLFEKAGFTIDGTPSPLLDGPRQVWRGSDPQHVRRMSWTPSRKVAEAYARGEGWGPGAGRLYSATVQPHQVLCVNESVLLNPAEVEWVVDTRGLVITEVPLGELASTLR